MAHPQIGDVFGELTVIGAPVGTPAKMPCRCSCGAEKLVRRDHIKSGATRSCGCVRDRRSSEWSRTGLQAFSTKHGQAHSRVYSIWHGIKQRFTNPNTKYFSNYGGRGITVCERWLVFENFLTDMGHPPDGFTIDRIDNDGDYEPGNCRWASRRDQANNRRVNRRITKDGTTRTIAEWSQLTGIHYNTLAQRLDQRLPVDEILDPTLHRDLSGLALGGVANGARQRAKTHCKFGHPFDEANTRWMGKSRGCRTCHREREAARRARLR